MAQKKRKLDKHDLAKRFGVQPKTVRNWVRLGCPQMRVRGANNRSLFDITAVEQWLASKGIQPGLHGREGGQQTAARQGLRKDAHRASTKRGQAKGAATTQSAPSPPAPPLEGLSEGGGITRKLERVLTRLLRVERDLGKRVRNAQAKENVNVLVLQGELNAYTGLIRELRQAAKAYQDLRVQRGELLPRRQFREKITGMGSWFRSALDRLADELVPRVMRELGKEGIELEDAAAVQRALNEGVGRRVEEYLGALAKQIREGPTEDETAE